MLKIAKEKAGLIVKDDAYQLPEDEFDEKGKIDSQRQLDLLKARYDTKTEGPEVFNPEQQEWEDNRMKIAKLKFGTHLIGSESERECKKEGEINFFCFFCRSWR